MIDRPPTVALGPLLTLFTASCAAPLHEAHDRRAAETPEEALGQVLDDLHDAAARADEERYFGHFLPDAVFIGTDASERWSLADFHAYAAPHFQGETAWTYRASERHVQLGPRGVAWFDERLWNEKYGETRGSGVLLHDGRRWRIAQYVLSFPIPNDLSRSVVELIRAAEQ